MRSLDEFYKYIEKQEHALRTQQTTEKPAAATGDVSENGHTAPVTRPIAARYTIRNGVTVLVRTAPDTPPSVVPAEPSDTGDKTSDALAEAYLPPIVEADEPPQVADIPKRLHKRSRPVKRVPTTPQNLSESEQAALWRQIPRHLQLLVTMTNPNDANQDGDGTTAEAKSADSGRYERAFQESQLQLIERLTDPTLTLEDTARVLGVCPTTVRRYTNRGLLPHHRTPGQQRRFRLSDVMAFWESQLDSEFSAPSLADEQSAELALNEE